MNVKLELLAIADPDKKTIIARRIAQHPKVTMGQALLLVDHVPSIILAQVDSSEAEALAEALEPLGCKTKIQPILGTDAYLEPLEKPKHSHPQPKSVKPEPMVDRQPMVFQSMPPPPSGKPVQITPAARTPPSRRQWLLWGIALLVFAVLILGRRQFTFQAPSASRTQSKPSLSQSKRRAAKIEQELQKAPNDPKVQTKAVKAYKQLAQNEPSPSNRIQHLSKAVRIHSGDSEARSMLSNAYVDTAKRVYDDQALVRFYKMAISFNRYNEQAWQGLIRAHKRLGEQEKAQEAQQKRDQLFGRRYQEVLSLIRPYGRVTEFPHEKNDTLYFGYRTAKLNTKQVLQEAHSICTSLQSIRAVSAAGITIETPSRQLLYIASPVLGCPISFKKWKSQVTTVKTSQ